MRTLTIEAVSLSSARSFYRALREFDVELEEHDRTYLVRVRFQRDSDIVLVLQALAQNVAARSVESRSSVGIAAREAPAEALAARDMAPGVTASAGEHVERSRIPDEVVDDRAGPDSRDMEDRRRRG